MYACEPGLLLPPAYATQILNLHTLLRRHSALGDILDRLRPAKKFVHAIWKLVTHPEHQRHPAHEQLQYQMLHNPIRRPKSTPRSSCSRMLFYTSSIVPNVQPWTQVIILGQIADGLTQCDLQQKLTPAESSLRVEKYVRARTPTSPRRQKVGISNQNYSLATLEVIAYYGYSGGYP